MSITYSILMDDFSDIKPRGPEIIPPASSGESKKEFEMKPVEVPENPLPEIKFTFLEKIRAYFFLKTNEGKIFMWETIKKFLVAKIVGWILKVGSGVLITLGISQGSVEEIAGAAVTFIIGLIISLVVNKKAALTNPNEFLKNY